MTSMAVQETGAIEAQDQTGISLAEYQRISRKDAITAILWGSGFILLHVILLAFQVIAFSDLFRSLLFIIGVVCLAAGIWEYYQAQRLTIEDLTTHLAAQEFAKLIEKTPIIYTNAVLACLIVVAVSQLLSGDEESI